MVLLSSDVILSCRAEANHNHSCACCMIFGCPPVAFLPGESGSPESAVVMATIVVALTSPATCVSAFPMVSALLQTDTSCIRKVVPIGGGWKLHVSWPNVVRRVMSLDWPDMQSALGHLR